MEMKQLKEIIELVQSKNITSDEAMKRLRDLPFVDFCIAKHDIHRPLRNGFSETVLCEGKSEEQVITIARKLSEKKINFFGTRVSKEIGERILREFKNDPSREERLPEVDYDPLSRTARVIFRKIEEKKGSIAVVCAGTADMAVAEETRRTAEYFGFKTSSFYDVGIAGLGRLLSSLNEIRKADCVIAVAGMEGAIASVLGGLLHTPIIAVPTSVGYGSNLKGFTTLLAMLNSCSEGIVVANIDNGFGAACAAARILNRMI